MQMDNTIRIVIAEDHQLIREGIRLILGAAKNFSIVGEAVNGFQAVELVQELQPDVVLLDIKMPEMDGIQAIPIIKKKSGRTKVLMLTAKMDETSVLKALTAGASGYLTKDTDSSSLIKAINVVQEGELWIERKLLARAFLEGHAKNKSGSTFTKPKEGLLTSREKEVLFQLTKGGTNKDIANKLFISEKTVKSHLNTIFRKLNVSRRLEAILLAIRSGLV
jgi:DNA-binding NarL/FixJ family response regulator